VLEIGSRARSGNTYRHLVHPEVDYVELDVAAGPNVDIVGDAHHLSRHVDATFDAVFSISVFQHWLMPWMVAIEMNRVMKPGALAYIQSHPAWPLHEEPWDFWRFSKDAWNGLFNAHTGFEMVDKGYAMGCLGLVRQ
jgi:SAM-dependent methyltransferase